MIFLCNFNIKFLRRAEFNIEKADFVLHQSLYCENTYILMKYQLTKNEWVNIIYFFQKRNS